mmetsp:Transcript_3610/g.3094  ORF Transcript_3610/g.3094 Transcript_3610/m.3094 type:complete len:133 (-) Transcript_3610:1679-2077(-)
MIKLRKTLLEDIIRAIFPLGLTGALELKMSLLNQVKIDLNEIPKVILRIIKVILKRKQEKDIVSKFLHFEIAKSEIFNDPNDDVRNYLCFYELIKDELGYEKLHILPDWKVYYLIVKDMIQVAEMLGQKIKK